MDVGMLQGAIVSLKAAADIAIAFKNLGSIADVQAKAIELQQVILSAQSSALAAQSQQFTLLEQIRGLEQELKQRKAWDTERERYGLVSPWQGAVTYALKRERSSGEPPHWICTNCYQEARKSILSDATLSPNKGAPTLVLSCPVCKAVVPSSWAGGSIERRYAEDVSAPA